MSSGFRAHILAGLDVSLSHAEQVVAEFRRTNTERLWLVERTAFEHYLQHGNLERGLDEKHPF